MPVVPIREILDRAFDERYGVAAINIVDDLSLEAVPAAAAELDSPLIVQTSLKTVQGMGADQLDVEENTRQTIEVVAEAESYGAEVEGEIETVGGVEDGVGSDDAGAVHPTAVSGEFIDRTGIYSFAPAIGTVHGLYNATPELHPERVLEIVAEHPIPMVLHGGTGLTEAQFVDLIARGCAKVVPRRQPGQARPADPAGARA
jgi:fructose/tagatose bisphosphate aldolase